MRILGLLLAATGAFAADVNTFSIVGYDPVNGDWGVAVASRYFSVGSVVPWAEAGVGAVATQANVNVGYGPRGLELLRHGLAARVVPPELVVEEAVRLGKEIALKAPISVRLAREAITRAFEGRVDDGIEFERKLFYLLFATQDAHEGMRAFVDKRQPAYQGR